MGAHLLSMAEELDYEVYYWREPARNKDEKDKEVDFVLALLSSDATRPSPSELTSSSSSSLSIAQASLALHSLERRFGRHSLLRRFVVGTGGVSLEDFLGSEVETLL